MKQKRLTSNAVLAAAAAVAVWGTNATVATATSPCDDFGECKALIEINSSDGDIGFHLLMDGDDLLMVQVKDPSSQKIFEASAKGPLTEQFLTEIFWESAEPLCWPDPDRDPDDEIVTLEEFLDRWEDGTYIYHGQGEQGEKSEGETELTYDLPAAPISLSYDDTTGVIEWEPGDDLGNCANNDIGELDDLIADGVIPDPASVPVSSWEIVFEPATPTSLKFTVRVFEDPTAAPAAGVRSVTVPADFRAGLLADFGPNLSGKIEVGAIGVDDNATFTEEGDICINETTGCPAP
jgi:hypothetical protein